MSAFWQGNLRLPWLIFTFLVVGLALTVSLQSLADSPGENDNFAYAKGVMVAQKCGSCHTLKSGSMDWNATIGPDLTHQARRGRSAAWLRAHLRHPVQIPDHELEPAFRGKQKLMPSFDHLSEKEVNAIITFLNSLH